MLQLDPHSPVLPLDTNLDQILQRLKLTDPKSLLDRPTVRLLSSPLSMLKIHGPLSLYKEKDSVFSSLFSSLNGDLVATSSVSFDSNYANHALWELFNFKNLNRRDKLTIGSFKILGLKVTANNNDLTDLQNLLTNYSPASLNRGVHLSLTMELK